MSEQTTIAKLGDSLFGSGPEAALKVMSKTFELAFLKALSQLSSPSADVIVDRTGHIGVAREIANYKVASALSEALKQSAAGQTDARAQQLLAALSAQFSDYASAAGQRIIDASALAGTSVTVEDAIAGIFQASPDFVAALLAPTPGIEWSMHEIQSVVDAMVASNDDSAFDSAMQQLGAQGVWVTAQSMTQLSLGLEAAQAGADAQSWHAVAAEAGAAALLLHSLFTDGNAAGLTLNTSVPFYQDPDLIGLVRDIINQPTTDFSVVESYLPEGQALALLVDAIDAGFTTAELNQLLDSVSEEGVAAVQAILEDLRAIVAPDAVALSAGGGPAFYRAAFDALTAVEQKYPSGLQLESLAAMDAARVSARASQEGTEGEAYRYALVELNAFVLVGADYSAANANGELDLYNADTGRGAITLEYLADRPELLAAMLGANVRDAKPDASGVWQVAGLGMRYVDAESGLSMTGSEPVAGVVMFDGSRDAPIQGGAGNDHLYGEEGNDIIDGGAGNDLLDGGSGNDTLAGGAGLDVVRGGAGDDVLIGGGDGDLLQGGVGNDIYRIRKGDVVQDADSVGSIVVERDDGTQVQVGGGTQIHGSAFFKSSDGEVVYRENDDGSVDFWVDGDLFSVRPGDESLAPRARRDDGSAPGDDGADSDSGLPGPAPKPNLILPLRHAGPPELPSYRAPFQAAQQVPAPRRDPLVFDLDGDGFDTLGQSAVTYFDHDANGFAELSGWVAGDDAFLVMDRNGNGRIDSGRELFGDQTVLASGAVAANGVQALAEWDSAALGGNGDGSISDSDSAWSQLQLWRDLDSDGYTDAGELFGLDSLGVGSISLGFVQSGAADGKGNQQARVGSFFRADGSQGAVGEYLLARTTAISIAESNVAVSAEIMQLPEVRGSGNVYDLRQAMARDAKLQELVSGFAKESDAVARDELLNRILFRWAGVDALRPDSRGDTIDARKLATLEHFLAEPFVGALGSDPLPDAAVQLERAYQDLSEQVYGKLMVQTHLAALYDGIAYRWDAAAGSVRADLSAVTSAIDAQLAADKTAGLLLLSEFARSMRALGELPSADYQALRARYAALGESYAIAFDTGGLNSIADVSGNTRINGTTVADSVIGTALADTIMGFDGDDVIYGLDGDDTLSGCEDNDQVFGGSGNDNLFGGLGDDVLDGGAGNDYLNGGSGNDVYVLMRGSGNDRVRDYDVTAGNHDVIRVEAGLTLADVRYWREGSDLLVGLVGSADSIRVQEWFADGAARVEEVVFSDGRRLGADLLAAARFSGTAGDDKLQGSNAGDMLEGLAGNDSLQGGYGNDVLDGGAGNDVMFGGFSGTFDFAGAGNDTYIFARGYGQDVINDHDTTAGNLDTIQLLGLNAADVTLSRRGSDMVIAINGTNDTLTVAGWSDVANRIEQVEFADGSVLDAKALNEVPFLGTEGNDTLAGSDGADTLRGQGGDDIVAGGFGDDVLDGGSGNDILYGGFSGTYDWSGAGNDTYVFGRGYGRDVIYDYDTTAGNVDTIRLVGLNQADVTLRRDNSTMYISVNGSADQLQVAGWGASRAYRIERIEFADGSVLEGVALDAIAFVGGDGVDKISATDGNDVVRGMGGNDQLYGGAGDDVLDGGTGNDSLYGGSGISSGVGNDTYVFGRGYGQDLIYDFDASAGNLDTIYLKDLNAADVTIKRDSSSFYILVNGTSDSLRVVDWGANKAYRMERVVFADGSMLDAAGLALTPYLGSAYGETIIGTWDNEVMRGFAGADTLAGGAGDDILDGGADNDNLKGESGNDVLLGGGGNDSLYGLDGNDVLDGGEGTDRMYGSTGDDTYWVDAPGDKVYESLGEGTDTVNSAVDNYTIGENVENLTLVGGAVRGNGNALANIVRGNALNNVLYGNAGSDLLDGGAGNDTMYGGTGNDTYVVDSTGDNVSELFGDGVDTVQSSVSHTLVDGVENLILTGSGAIDGSGNALANTITGNAADNVLSGAAGNDQLEGGGGFDVLRGGKDNDVLRDSADGAVLDGGTGADTLVSQGSASFIAGGKGDDIVEAGAGGGAHVIAHNRGDGADTLRLRGGDATLSLGGGTARDDLKLRKDGANLVLELGDTDSVTLEGWYDASQTRPNHLTLQMIEQAVSSFDLGALDLVPAPSIESFDLASLAAEFDAARQADPTVDRWSAMHKLLNTHLETYDGAALGGDMAYAYAMNGNLGLSAAAMQETLRAPGYGNQAQDVNVPLVPKVLQLL